MNGIDLEDGTATAVSATTLRATVEELASARYAGRRVASVGGGAARACLARRLEERGAIDVRVERFPVAAGEAGNLHARLGTGRRDVELLLTAHFDGVGDLPDRRRPGASDNASGVAVVLEAARLLAQALPSRVGVSLALLDAEEVGALGSAWHARQLTAEGARPLILNVDGAGRIVDAVAVEAAGAAQGLLAALDQAGRTVGVPLAPGQVASDNRQYGAAGFAALGIGAGMPGYHTEYDTAERVETETLVAITRLVVATVRELDAAGSGSTADEQGEGED
jgi:Zn-dependent M28 family amino/carboxypeptidase